MSFKAFQGAQLCIICVLQTTPGKAFISIICFFYPLKLPPSPLPHLTFSTPLLNFPKKKTFPAVHGWLVFLFFFPSYLRGLCPKSGWFFKNTGVVYPRNSLIHRRSSISGTTFSGKK
jgi:hypothetical protein